jgi:hypothetical protein
MRIAVFGTGVVGRTLAARLDGLGHEVVLGTRDPAAASSRTEPDQFGTTLAGWLKEHASVRVASFADAALGGEVIVNATAGLASLEALRAAGAERLNGKVLIDVANALDFSQGMPPRVEASSETSLAERIQHAFPGTRVVKTLNTMNAGLMVEPMRVGDGKHTVFLSGDDLAAKQVVIGLLQSFGWQDIVDLGGLATARGTEMLLPLWISLMGALGVAPGAFQFRVVR